MIRALVLSVAVAIVAADFTEVPFKNCKSTFEVKKLEMSDCTPFDEGSTKACLFKPDTKPTIKITFVPNESGVDNLETFVRAKFGQSQLPYTMTDFETCKHGGIQCPLEAGKEYVYTQAMNIEASYPKDQLFQVNWGIGRDKKKPEVCTVFLAKIAA